MEKLKYLEPDYKLKISGNCQHVVQFIGPVPPCPICENYGEYDDEYGRHGCGPCNSRLIPFIDHNGKRDYVDWGDTLERREDGLHLIKGNNND